MEKLTYISYTKTVNEKRTRAISRKIKKSNSQQSFGKSIIRVLFITLIILLLLFALIIVLFVPDSILVAGHNLKKSDWLVFVGAFLGACATICLGVITCAQTHFYARRDEETRKKTRQIEIRPIFSIEKIRTEAFTESFVVEIENVGKYPVRNIIINDCYVCQILKTDEKKKIEFTYSDKENTLSLLKTGYEKDSSGYAKVLLINYDDVDGEIWSQVYELKQYDRSDSSSNQYFLTSIEQHW